MQQQQQALQYISIQSVRGAINIDKFSTVYLVYIKHNRINRVFFI